MNEQQPQIIIKESTQVYGLLSVIFGFVGIFILSFLLSPLAFILGIISAILGALTSPVLMALFGMTTVTYFGDVIVL